MVEQCGHSANTSNSASNSAIRQHRLDKLYFAKVTQLAEPIHLFIYVQTKKQELVWVTIMASKSGIVILSG